MKTGLSGNKTGSSQLLTESGSMTLMHVLPFCPLPHSWRRWPQLSSLHSEVPHCYHQRASPRNHAMQ